MRYRLRSESVGLSQLSVKLAAVIGLRLRQPLGIIGAGRPRIDRRLAIGAFAPITGPSIVCRYGQNNEETTKAARSAVVVIRTLRTRRVAESIVSSSSLRRCLSRQRKVESGEYFQL